LRFNKQKRNYISRTQVIMKTFAAALFAAVVSATSYTATGTADGTAVKSSKVTVTTSVVSKKLTQKHVHNAVSKDQTKAADNVVSVLCTTKETGKFVCSYCEAQYVSADKYKAIWAAYDSVKALELKNATDALTSMTNLGTVDKGIYTMADTAWGTTTAKVDGESAVNWKITSIKGSTKNTLDCDSTFTDPTDNTTTREDAVKKGMATAQHATSAKINGTVASKLATAKLVTGALSTVATVGAAIAALSMSF